jgi:hypothetical protein
MAAERDGPHAETLRSTAPVQLLARVEKMHSNIDGNAVRCSGVFISDWSEEFMGKLGLRQLAK